MRWTKLRKALRDRMADAVRDRLAVHQARYRNTGEEAGRVWLELDGRELISFETARYAARRAALEHEIRSGTGPLAPEEGSGHAGYRSADAAARDLLRRAGEYDDYSALEDLRAYLSLSIAEALQSESPLIRGLAMVDRRLGKQRLRALGSLNAEHPLVRELYRARCEAERVNRGPRTSRVGD